MIGCGCRWDEFADEYDDDGGGDGDDRPVPMPRSELIDLVGVGLPVGHPPCGPSSEVRVDILPFAAAVAPLRAVHHADLHRVAEWCLQRGRPCDLDVVALCLDVLAGDRSAHGYDLDRPKINNHLRAHLPNRATMLRTLLPDDVPVHLWTTITWLCSEGRLSSESDPLGALFEPLGCYGGLGVDGYPLPPGTDVDFPCQCFVKHDPSCPPGYAQRIIGRDWQSGRELVVRARLHPRSVEPPAEVYEPLAALARRRGHGHGGSRRLVEHLLYTGLIDDLRDVPPLSMYVRRDDERQRLCPVMVDDTGDVWVPKPDRRCRAGYRWIRDAASARELARVAADPDRELAGRSGQSRRY
jgi:hypothetical protein